MHTNFSFPESHCVHCGGNALRCNRSAKSPPTFCASVSSTALVFCTEENTSIIIFFFFFFPSVFSDAPTLMPSQRGAGADCCTTGLAGRDFWANCIMNRIYLCCIGCEADCKTCLELCKCDTKLGNSTCVLILIYLKKKRKRKKKRNVRRTSIWYKWF